MVRAVSTGAVAVLPPVVTGEQPIERLHHIGLGSAPELHHEHPGRGVRDEHVEDAVRALRDLGRKCGAHRRQVMNAPAATGVDRKFARMHVPSVRDTIRNRCRPRPVASAS